ncbi:MAG: helix-turn-helix transcriptional regulator, partial [Kovacikia sp.]
STQGSLQKGSVARPVSKTSWLTTFGRCVSNTAKNLYQKLFISLPSLVQSPSVGVPSNIRFSGFEEYVLELAIAGKTNWEIARQMKVDISLPHSIIRDLCQRLDVRSREELIRQVIQWKLIEPALRPPTPYTPLSALERYVLKLTIKGKTNWEIAKWISVDVAVIEVVITRLCQKLKVRSRRKLVERAICWKLLK